MSASLVGSEMCIRDRCSWCPTLLPLTVLSRPRHPALRGSARRGCPWGGSCLLYTSDAADDM
eukprot:7539771-Alexandrium_andersonii.AAC.1